MIELNDLKNVGMIETSKLMGRKIGVKSLGSLSQQTPILLNYIERVSAYRAALEVHILNAQFHTVGEDIHPHTARSMPKPQRIPASAIKSEGVHEVDEGIVIIGTKTMQQDELDCM